MNLTFGKYKGWELSQVPDDYIEYMISSNEKSLRMFKDEKERRITQAEAKMPMMERLIQAGYRQLATQNHPDKGGNTRTMQEINAAHERLKDIIRRL